jgi:alpha-glucosidase (family GH31 glycosyl hydrolase)
MIRSITSIFYVGFIVLISCRSENPLYINGELAQLDIRMVSKKSIRVTLKPLSFQNDFPINPALIEREYPEAAISLKTIGNSLEKKIGELTVKISVEPLTITILNTENELVQELQFLENGNLAFKIDDYPILGLGEGGPQPESGADWNNQAIEFDRKGRFHNMQPRWQSNAYGSRNPVPLILGTGGWGLFSAAPWVQIDLRDSETGLLIPWNSEGDLTKQNRVNQQENRSKGKPPVESTIKGLWDLFVFDASNPKQTMKDISDISGISVMPPKWAMGYMQSHRTLKDENQMIEIVDTFREKKIPLDAVIYLGTGFCPRGWNEYQPSFKFNDELFLRDPEKVITDLHNRNVKVVVHIVPYDRDQLPTLQGSIPPTADEILNESHIQNYWAQHTSLMESGIDAFWPDEGDWFDLFERIKRHQLYYQGPISTKTDIRPWSLHRNGYLGIGKWGGWVWSGDTQSSWKTLEAQIAVGINHSLSLSPYWGSDIGGFYPNAEKTGELYARWFQFGVFNPSFRSHGRTWLTALPWGFGLSDMGVREPNGTNDMSEVGAEKKIPLQESMNNPFIEPIIRKYAELRYQLMSYNYTLTWQARVSGMPMMRALWLHYPEDEKVRGIGNQYLWGKDMLIAPVFKKDATKRNVYLPEGHWYDWWTNERKTGGETIIREVNLETMPIYVRAGAIIPFDPVRQYTSEEIDNPTTIKIYPGSDGEFVMYEDDGHSLQYLKGDYTLTRFIWDDANRKLTITTFTNTQELTMRKFILELISQGIRKTVEYDYTHIEINLL